MNLLNLLNPNKTGAFYGRVSVERNQAYLLRKSSIQTLKTKGICSLVQFGETEDEE